MAVRTIILLQSFSVWHFASWVKQMIQYLRFKHNHREVYFCRWKPWTIFLDGSLGWSNNMIEVIWAPKGFPNISSLPKVKCYNKYMVETEVDDGQEEKE